MTAPYRGNRSGNGETIGSAGLVQGMQFRQTEIQDFGGAIGRNHQVVGLQIAMNDADFMCLGERVGNLCRDRDGLAKWYRPRGEQLTHRLAANQFHRDVVRAVYVSEFVNGDDVGMIQRARRTGFLLKSR